MKLIAMIISVALAVPASSAPASKVHIGTALTCHGHGHHHKCCEHGTHYGPKGHKQCDTKHHR